MLEEERGTLSGALPYSAPSSDVKSVTSIRSGLIVVLLCLPLPLFAQKEEPTGAPAAAEISRQADKPGAASAGVSSQSNSHSPAELDLKPNAKGALSQEQMQKLLHVVADKDIENDKRLHDYTYIERHVQHSLDGKGQAKSTEIETYEGMELYGEQVMRLTEKNDKPLSEKDAAKEEKRIQKLTDKRKNESEDERRKREEKEDKDREDGRKFVREVADAYNFRLVGIEQVDGRDAWVIDGEPRPGYEPHMKEAKFLPKFHGRVWIDKKDLQWTKLDVECLDTVSLGWVLARIHKGTRVVIEQTRVNDEVWLPRHLAFKFNARVALFKGYNVDGEQSYRDYKKFRASAKVVGVGEVK